MKRMKPTNLIAFFLILSSQLFAAPQDEHEWLYAWVDHLSLRDSPSLQAKVKGYLAEGQAVLWEMEQSQHTTKVKLRGKTYDKAWYKVTVGGKEAWVHAGGLQKSSPRFSEAELSGKKADWFDSPAKRFKWWNSLSPAWQEAFDGGVWSRYDDPEVLQPSDEEISRLFKETSLYLESEPPCEASYFQGDLMDLSGVQNLSKLNELTIAGTQLEDISALAELPALTILELRECELASGWAVLSHLPRLEKLNLSFNKIPNLNEFPALPSLEVLNLSTSELESTEGLKRFPILNQIDLSGNFIEKLSDFQKLTLLSDANVSSNKLSHLNELQNLKALSSVNAGYNEIDNIQGLTSLPALTYVYLEGNHIEDLSPLKGKAQLEYLNLGENPIGNLEVFSKLLPLESLTILNLSRCDLDGLASLKNLPNLQHLELFGCTEESFGVLKSFPSLESIGWDDLSSGDGTAAMRDILEKDGIEIHSEYEGCGC